MSALERGSRVCSTFAFGHQRIAVGPAPTGLNVAKPEEGSSQERALAYGRWPDWGDRLNKADGCQELLGPESADCM